MARAEAITSNRLWRIALLGLIDDRAIESLLRAVSLSRRRSAVVGIAVGIGRAGPTQPRLARSARGSPFGNFVSSSARIAARIRLIAKVAEPV